MKTRMHSLQPRALACCKQLAKVDADMNPSLAGPLIAGLPMTNFDKGTPALELIWNNAESGQVLEDALRRFAHVVYSDTPS
jgi:hypothetical protein